MAISLLNNIIAKGILNVFNIIIPLLIVPYIYRVFNPVIIGEIEYAMTLYTYFSLLGLLGIYNYGLRELSKNRVICSEKNKPIFINLFYIGTCSNILSFIIYNITIYFICNDHISYQISFILGFNLLAQIFYTEWVNEAYEEFKFITVKTVIIRVVSLIFIFLLVKNESDYNIYVVITVAVLLLNNIVSFIYVGKLIHVKLIDFTCKIKWRKYLPPLLLILILNNTNILYTMVDKTFLGIYSTSESVAYYSVGQKITEIIKALILPVVLVTLPRLSAYLSMDKELYQKNLILLMKTMLLIVIPTSVGIILLSEDIINVFAGSQYIESLSSFRIFSVRLILMSIEFIIYNQIIFLHKKEKMLVIFNLICGGLNVFTDYTLKSILTPSIAITTTLLCEILFELLCISYIYKYLKINTGLFYKSNLKYIFFSLSFIPIIFFIKSHIDNAYAVFILSILLCCGIYCMLLYISKDYMFKLILNKFLKK